MPSKNEAKRLFEKGNERCLHCGHILREHGAEKAKKDGVRLCGRMACECPGFEEMSPEPVARVRRVKTLDSDEPRMFEVVK